MNFFAGKLKMAPSRRSRTAKIQYHEAQSWREGAWHVWQPGIGGQVVDRVIFEVKSKLHLNKNTIVFYSTFLTVAALFVRLKESAVTKIASTKLDWVQFVP